MDECKNITLDNCIEYFQTILNDGCVSGTDFELNDEETQIYIMTISSLKILKETCKLHLASPYGTMIGSNISDDVEEV